MAVVASVKNPHLYFLDVLGLLKKDWIFETKDGKLIVRPSSSDKWVALENLVFKQFEFERFADNFDTVIDLGANIGASAVLIHSYFNDAKIICFEPDPENYKYLLKNIKLNNLKDYIECVNVAISESKDKTVLFNSNYDSSSSSTFFGAPNSDFFYVNNFYFDELKKYVRGKTLLKMDVEGEEFNLFKEKHLDLIKLFSGVVLEYHELYVENGGERIPQFLKKSGFKYEKYGAFVLVKMQDC